MFRVVRHLLFMTLLLAQPLFSSWYQQPEKYAHIDSSLWNQLAPYFLPEGHPIKSALDHIFFKKRATESEKSLKKSHFNIVNKQKWSITYVVSHKKLKGFLLKIFLDDGPGIREWENWLDRIIGAQRIISCIERHGYHHLFKIPKKWIYPLPKNPPPSEGSHRKNFVLVVQDMKIKNEKENENLWKGKLMTEEMLAAIYTVLKEEGLHDVIYPFNLPFSKDKKLAFIDTERSHVWPVHFHILTEYLSKKNQKYWNKLIANDH